MQVSIERLRVWLLLGAGGLLLVLAGFLGYARLTARRLLHDLPGRLGAEISREANGFTYSQSNGKRTLYTIHAARFVQHKNNLVTLHDVGIVLYDTANHADRIYGKEFEYDQTSGMLRATGEVFLDLAAPTPADTKSRAAFAAGALPGAATPKTGSDSPSATGIIHVKTSAVLFAQKQGLASTDQPVEFTYGDVNGSSVGADFRSDTGATILRSQVHLNAIRHGQPVQLTADRAELDRQQQQVLLDHVQTILSMTSARSTRQTASADHATLLLRTATSPERLHAEGSVVLSGEAATVHADRGAMLLGPNDQPQTADLAGNVRFLSDQPKRHVEGGSSDAHARFDSAGELQQVLLEGSAHVQQRQPLTSGRSIDRNLTAGQLNLTLASAGQHRRWLKDVTATGSAHFTAHQPSPTGAPTTDELGADLLIAHLRQSSSGADTSREEISTVDGQGHTAVHRISQDGAETQSFGDTLQATFSPPSSQPRPPGSAQAIQTAGQVGHVRVDQQTPAKPANAAGPSRAASLSHGTADRLSFDGPSSQATLLGHVQLTQEGSVLWSDRVLLTQGTGDATATGKVKLSYRSSPTSEPVQVLAAQAQLQHDLGRTTFFGGPGTPARMWQGASAVEAPVIELGQKEGSLRAHGAPGSSDPSPVHTVLANAPAAAAPPASKRTPTPAIRVLSRDLLYIDADRTARFTGGVDVNDGTATIRATEATVFLSPRSAAAATTQQTAAASAPPFLGSGALDHIVATGSIRVQQPGRLATGERLVYTASDRVSVLTGSPAKPPVVTDDESGTLSGTTIRFLPGDNGQNSVVVSGGGTSEPKLRTETRGKQR